jgi:putative transposase
VRILLQRDGSQVYPKRIWRVYREIGLRIRNKTLKHRGKAKLSERRWLAVQINETRRWFLFITN